VRQLFLLLQCQPPVVVQSVVVQPRLFEPLQISTLYRRSAVLVEFSVLQHAEISNHETQPVVVETRAKFFSCLAWPWPNNSGRRRGGKKTRLKIGISLHEDLYF
jgi:hypothetical protein